MMRALLALALFAFMLPAQAGMHWSDLWRNPDQQGEALLQHGDAAAAAKVYKDARRKAYAELKAGDYAAAARDLAALDDSDANYNRGNALAYAGDLQGAISAYDAALQRDPHNQDAIHNRELVESALKQQRPQQQNSDSDKSKDGKSNGQNGNSQNSSSRQQGNQSGQAGNKAGQGQNSSAQDNSQQPGSGGDRSKDGKQAGQQGGSQGSSAQGDGEQAGQNGNNKSGRQGQSSANNQAQTGQAGDNTRGQSSSAQGTSGNQAMQQQQAGKEGAGPGQQASQMAQGQAHDDAEQARRDAAASLAYAASNKQGGNGSANEADGNAVQQPTAPMSEQQLAQEQWLHSIPDDPGGLLRRKFMIEHMMRQQKEQP